MNLKKHTCKKKIVIQYLQSMQILTILIVILIINITTPVIAQMRTINGTVINEKSEPLPSVTVNIKNTGKTVSTNDDGKFYLINIPAGSILSVSYVGYISAEYAADTLTNTPLLTLKINSKELSEVEIFSNGYQEISKERAAGSFIRIDNKTFNQQAGTEVLKRLNNVTSGLLFNIGKSNLNPQNNTNISIRGLGTINGPLDPLIVLDGFIYDGNIQNLNPNDIDNISILKDATATSIWGARAGNGVLVINTKRGKYNQKLSIGVNANFIIAEKSDLYDLPQMKTSDYINVEQLLFKQGFFDDQINLGYAPITPAVEVFLSRRNGLISSEDSLARINKLNSIDSRTEYLNQFYTKPITQQYSINIAGGNNNTNYSGAISMDRNIGETYSTYNKINVRLDNSVRAGKRITLNYGGYFTNGITNSGRPAYNNFTIGSRQVPYLRFTDDTGNPLPLSNTYSNSYIDTAGGGKLLDWRFYPTENYKHEKAKTRTNEIFAYGGVNYKVMKVLDLDIKYQYQNQRLERETIRDIESFTTRNYINLFSQLDRSTGVVKYVIPLGGIRDLATSSIQSQTVRGQLNFHNNNNRNSINAILGSEVRESISKSESNTLFGYQDDPLTFSNVDYINYYKTFITGYYQTVPFSPSFSHIVNRFVSFYGNAAYTFDNKYTITASARRDGSNIFGAATNDKWRPLWSAGALWSISNEKFYNIAFLPQLRARLTYGYSGNVDLSKSSVAVGRYFSASSNTNLPFARVTTLNNPELRWERTGQINLGVDFAFTKSIVSGSVEFYQKRGVDLYGQAPFDYTAWGYLSQLTRNVAGMKGNGVDIIIHTKNIDTKFKWNTIFLFNYNSNKTTKYDADIAQSISSKLGDGITISPFIGKPLYSIAAFRWGGLDVNGNPQGYVESNLTTDYQLIFDKAELESTKSSSIKFMGSSSPTVFGNFTNTISMYNVSISINLSYRFGYYFRKSTISYSDLIYNGRGHSDFGARWQNSGDEKTTNIPSFEYPTDARRDFFFTNSEINVFKADNVRFEYFNLSYNLKGEKFKNPLFHNLEVYFNTSNLGIIWKGNKADIDPDYPNVVKPPKTFVFGIRANL